MFFFSYANFDFESEVWINVKRLWYFVNEFVLFCLIVHLFNYLMKKICVKT